MAKDNAKDLLCKKADELLSIYHNDKSLSLEEKQEIEELLAEVIFNVAANEAAEILLIDDMKEKGQIGLA